MTQLSAVQASAVPGTEPLNLEPIHFINLVKGFSRVFWGLALTAILLLSQVKIELFSGLRLPAFFIGTWLHCWGLLTLWRAGQISSRWRLLLSSAIFLTLLEVYFFPFVRWWNMMPYVSFFTFNVGALATAVILSLYLSNIIAADLFNHLSLRGERLEARIYAGAIIGFMAVPLLVVAAFSGISAFRYQTMFIDELIGAVHCVPLWLYIVVTIPYSLTLAVLWKARDRSFRQFCMAKKTT